jgi:hypothetical protein
MPFGSGPGAYNVWLFLLACLACFVTNYGPTYRFALGFSRPLKQHVQQEAASEEANRS